MAGDETHKSAEENAGYQDRFWIPRFWDGMNPRGWCTLLLRNRCRIAPRRWLMALVVTICGQFNFLFWLMQMILLGRKIDRTAIKDPPIFVIGHWRSGTTLLHELLVLDARHTFPDTYDCFAPNHFLVSGWFFRPVLGVLLPNRRPMDNMSAGWDHPQEDEFALCNLGLPSPYRTIAFPNEPPQDQEYFSLDRATPEGRTRWKRGFLWFLKCLTLRNPKRIILKSPPHTFRIKVLLELFPNARFIHIIRNPYVIFPSTVNLWKRLYADQGLQTPTGEGLEEYVLETFRKMYEVFERDRHLIPPENFCQVRYEDLVADPLGQMETVYQRLGLGKFQEVLPALTAYFARNANYQTNRYRLAPELEAEISRRWSPYIRRYGYAEPPPAVPAPSTSPSVLVS
ncbi:MAG: sulfotransferase [Thermoguttaceae bacterium]|jgi:hypothetical protein